MSGFTNILIANRGEIACRIISSVKQMGLRAIAVYSQADSETLHVAMADDSFLLGGNQPNESYLSIDKILEAAKVTGAQAIHPGYGFLSENAQFAKACADAGLVFIGPSPHAIETMGNKATAKRLMIKAGVPCVPGYEDEDQSDKALAKAAGELGFPVMVKAAAGGGGRGMRLVHDKGDLAEAIAIARSEAENAFGSAELILEKAIINPRHVEIQIFADNEGNTIYLGERDCSVQRRHQKVIEEAPSPAVNETLRKRMGQAAVKVAQAVNYSGAGTVEFLLDENDEFYFLEMNTRLQVEHPVTEMITGLDLVEMQIRVARGEGTGLTQDDIVLDGHSMEVRLYAEDPANDFLPATGKIQLWQPSQDKNIRIDDCIFSGGEVSPFYDPMLAKIISWGESREAARVRLVNALKETSLFGITSNRDFLIDVLSQERFVQEKATTAFIQQTYGDEGYKPTQAGFDDAAIAAVISFELKRDNAMAKAFISPGLANWSSLGSMKSYFKLASDGSKFSLRVTPEGDGYHVTSGEDETRIEIIERQSTWCRLRIAGRVVDAGFYASGADIHLSNASKTCLFKDVSSGDSDNQELAGSNIIAPMHGRIIEITVTNGDRVKAGDSLGILEAMKMQHQLLAQVAGEVVNVRVNAGSQIAAGDLLIEIREDQDATGK